MDKIKISLVITTLNEGNTINNLLDSLEYQILYPDEVIIVDGGSTDSTIEKIKRRKNKNLKLKLFIEKGANRARGRNFGVQKSNGNIIAFTDAGCILKKDWLLEITKPFSNPNVKVVAGYYQGKPKNIFEKCVIPYALVMPDKIKGIFYPSSRSMAIRKDIFLKLGGFPEEFSDNEDYVFAHKIKKEGIIPVFTPKAVVYWMPRKNLKEFWTMIFRFARGDAKAGLRKLKVFSIFFRYFLFFILFLSSIIFNSFNILFFLIFVFLSYLSWSVFKNYHYVKHLLALIYLPVLQITSDFAVISGTISGLLEKLKIRK